MQIAPLSGSTATVGGRQPATGVALRGAGSAAPVLLPVVDEGSRLSSQAGLRSLDPGLNGRVAAGQQTLDFLEQADRRLQGLKFALSGTLADGADDAMAAALKTQVDRFAGFWQQRGSATAGALDGQLNYGEPGSAVQRFRVRGLDFASLTSGERETLSLTLGGRGATATVLVEPAAGERAQLVRFDQAVAPLGLRAQRDSAGKLVFEVAEAEWPVVRDALSIKGEGQRFPTGQFHRVRSEAAADAVQPQHWQTQDASARRQSLQEVVGAIDLVRRTHAGVSQSMAAVASELEAVDTEAGVRAAAFAERFSADAGRAHFDTFAALAPALMGVSRQRVEALLRYA